MLSGRLDRSDGGQRVTPAPRKASRGPERLRPSPTPTTKPQTGSITAPFSCGRTFSIIGVAGLGVGSIFAVIPAYFLRVVPATETGSATSFKQILRYVGYSVGSALSAVLLQAHTSPGHSYPTNAGYTVVGLVSCLLWVLTGAAATVLPLRRTRRSPRSSRDRRVRRRFSRCPVQ